MMYITKCFCGVIDQRLPYKSEVPDNVIEASLCHCETCRHATGMLCMAYYPLSRVPDTTKTKPYTTAGGAAMYFCPTCGCHVFRSRQQGGKDMEWGVATGAVVGLEGDDVDRTTLRFFKHKFVEDTIDGGASTFIQLTETPENRRISSPDIQESSAGVLPASCACGTVSLHITRPNADSLVPHSTFPDLTHAYYSTDPAVLQNSSKEKWWVRGNKYLAGTCACASCRKGSGFEIQSWTFVPRTNIFFRIGDDIIPLDFKALPDNVLHTYRSSQGVAREFCGGCGATIFWHDEYRPDVVDVSVGLLKATEGVRAESWLEWWTERVSFAEEICIGRSGPPAEAAKELLVALEKGLKRWESDKNRAV